MFVSIAQKKFLALYEHKPIRHLAQISSIVSLVPFGMIKVAIDVARRELGRWHSGRNWGRTIKSILLVVT